MSDAHGVLPGGSFEENEHAALEFCNEVARTTFQQELQAFADGFAQFVEVSEASLCSNAPWGPATRGWQELIRAGLKVT